METDAASGRPAPRGVPRGRTAVVGLALLLLLVVVAVASSARDRGSVAPAPQGLPVAMFDYLYTLGVLLVGAALLTLLFLRVPFVPPQRDPTGFFRLALFMAFLAALGYLAARGAFGGEGRALLQELLERQENAGGAAAVEDPGGGREARFRWELGAVVALAAAAAGAAHLLRRARRRAQPAGGSAAEQLAEVLDDTLDDLRAERDARRAVIAAYARMERTLAAHRLPRRASEAPLEYLARALRELQVPAVAALELTALFERAKFSRHEIDVGMKEEAISALVAVRDDLRTAA